METLVGIAGSGFESLGFATNFELTAVDGERSLSLFFGVGTEVTTVSSLSVTSFGFSCFT